MEQEQEARKLEEAWIMMPRLFDIWDVDASGELDRNELLTGVEKFCDAAGLDFDSRRVVSILSEVDDNSDCVLDRREFSIFLARFAESVNVPLDDFAFAVAEQLADIAMEIVPQEERVQQRQVSPKRSLWNRDATKTKAAAKAQQQQQLALAQKSWTQLKFKSEALYNSKPSAWERLRLGLAMRNFRTAEQKRKTSATIDLWFSIQKALVMKKRKTDAAKEASMLEDAGSKTNPRGFIGALDAIRRKGQSTMNADQASRRPTTEPGNWIKDRFLVNKRGSLSSSSDNVTLLEDQDYDEEHLLSISQLENFRPYPCDGDDDDDALSRSPNRSYAYDMTTQL